jgi:predicted sulfurtransferase
VFTLKESQNSPVLENKTETVLPHETATMVTEKQAVIVDVREESEWNQQRIPGAIHIPLAQLNERLAELNGYKDTPTTPKAAIRQAILPVKQSCH